jgi:branched-chain amino acid transport system substrate-binding protein
MSISAVTSPDHRYGKPRIRVRRWQAVGLLASAVLLASCSSSSTTSSSGGSAGTAASSTFCQGGVTDVSYAGPMSGAEATYGQEQYDGLSLAVSLFNSAGGFTAGPLKGCKVKVLGPYDDESEPSTGATIATRLSTNSHLLMYFGDVDSGVTLAALPILSRAGIPVINSYSSSPELTSLGYKDFFRVILNDNSQGSAIADLLKNTFHDTRYAAVWPDDVFGQGISAAFLKEAASLGASVPVNYSYPSTQTDFSVLASKVRGAHVDAVALLGVYSTDGLVVKQLASTGIPPSASTVYLANASDNAPQFVSLAGASAANGVYITGLWNPANASAAGKVFAAKFESVYHSAPAEDAATAYDAFNVFAHAVDQGGGTRSELIAALQKITPSNPFAGLTGAIGFLPTGQRAVEVPILLKVVNGQIVAAPSTSP